MKQKNGIVNILTFFVIIGITFSIPTSYAVEQTQEIFLQDQNSVFQNNVKESEVQHVLKLQESIHVSLDKKNNDKQTSTAEKIGILKLSENISISSNDPDYPTILNVKHQSDIQTTKERIYNSEKFKLNSKIINLIDYSLLNQNFDLESSKNLIEIFSNNKINNEIDKIQNSFFIDPNLSIFFDSSPDQLFIFFEVVKTIESEPIIQFVSDGVESNNPAILLLLAPLTGVVLISSEKNNFKLKISRQTQSSILAFLILFSAVSIPLSISDNYWGPQLVFADSINSTDVDLQLQNITDTVEESIQNVSVLPNNSSIFENSNVTNELIIVENQSSILTETISNSTVTETIFVSEELLNQLSNSSAGDSFGIGDYIVIHTTIAENYEPEHSDSFGIGDYIVIHTTAPRFLSLDDVEPKINSFSIGDSIVLIANGTVITPTIIVPSVVEPDYSDSFGISDEIDIIVSTSIPEADESLLTTNTNQTSVRLDGEDDYIIISNSTVTDSVSELTVSGWIKPDYSQGSQEFTVISKENQFALSINNILTPEHIGKFSVFDGISWNVVESSIEIKEEWTHMAATFNGTQIKIFINGTLSGSEILPGQIALVNGSLTASNIESISSESDILIGGYLSSRTGNGTVSNEFSGQIDNISIFDEKLTEEQISLIYQEKIDEYNSVPTDELDLDAILKEISDEYYNSTSYEPLLTDTASISDKIILYANGELIFMPAAVVSTSTVTTIGNITSISSPVSISDEIDLTIFQEALLPSILGEDLLVSPQISGSGTNFMINQDAVFEFQFYDENDALLVDLAELEYTASVLTGETEISSHETNSTAVEIAPVETNSTAVEIAPVETNSTAVEIAPVDTNSTNTISNFVGMLFGLELVQFADAKKMSDNEKLDYDLVTVKSKISEIKSKIADLKKNSKLDNEDNKENKKELKENKKLKKELKKELEEIKKELKKELKEIKKIAKQMKKMDMKSNADKLDNELSIVEQFSDIAINATQKNIWKGLQTEIKTEFYDATGNNTSIDSEITKSRAGLFDIKLLADDMMKPGLYTMKTTLIVDGEEFVSENEFTWGLVSVNTERSIYPLDEESVWIDVVVLNATGAPVCDSDITMSITDPNSSTTIFTDEDGISPLGCGSYHSSYDNPSIVGNYTINIEAETGNGSVDFSTYFLVQDSFDYDILRSTESVIDPFYDTNEIDVAIEIMSFVGNNPLTIREYVPSFFEIVTEGTVETVGNKKVISWTITPDEEGNTGEFGYVYSVPLISPQLYALGKIEVEQENVPTFTEGRNWYVAIDPFLIDGDVSPEEDRHGNTGTNNVVINATHVYNFYADGSHDLSYKLSTDRGQTWTGLFDLGADADKVVIAGGSHYKIEVWYEPWTPGRTNEIIHVAAMEANGEETIEYFEIDPHNPDLDGITPTNTAGASGIDCTASCWGTTGNANDIDITMSVNGILYVAGVDSDDSATGVGNVMQCDAAGSDCTNEDNWSIAGVVNSAPWGTGEDGNDSVNLLPLSGGDGEEVMLIRHDHGNQNDFEYKVWDGGSWDGTWTQLPGGSTGGADCDDSGAYRHHNTAIVNPNTEEFWAACIDNPTNSGSDIRFWNHDGQVGSSWTQLTDIENGDSSDKIDIAFGIDTDTDTLYAAWLEGATDVSLHLYKAEYLGSDTWGADEALTTATGDYVGVQMTMASNHFLYVSYVDWDSDLTNVWDLSGHWVFQRIYLTDSLNAFTSNHNRRVTIQKADSIDLSDFIPQKLVTLDKRDTIISSDSISKIVTLDKRDTIISSDSINKIIIKQPVDSIDLSDFIPQKLVTLDKQDTVDTSDSINKIITSMLDDSLNVFDSISKSITKDNVDTISVSDSISKSISTNLFDTISVSDLISKSVDILLNDSISITDSIVKSITKSLKDIISITENVATEASITKSLDDNISITDNISKSITQVLNDNISITDNLDTSKQITQTLNDSISITDNLDTTASITQTLNDSISITDNLDTTASITQTLNDNISITDNLDTTASITQTLNDSIAVTDNLATSKTITQTLNDSISITDNLDTTASITQTLNDSISITDNLDTTASITQTLNDSIAVTDNLATTKSITQTLNDSIAVTDNLATSKTITQTLNDSIAVTDNLATTKSITQVLNDSITVTDNISRSLTQTLNDSITVTDNLVSSAVITQTLNDSISVTDNLATTKSITQTLNDSISVTDNLATTASITQTLNDSIAVTDNLATTKSITQTLNDNISVTDNLDTTASITQTLNDSIAVTDNLATTKSITQTLNDSISVTDNLATTKSITQTLNDSITVTDNISRSLTQTLNDSITVTDNLVSSAVITQVLDDSISVTDNLATTKSITQTLNDNISVTDNLDTTASITQTLNDSIAVTDNLATTKSITQTLNDNISVTDNLVSSAVITQTLNDSIAVTDNLATSKTITQTLNDSIAVTDNLATTKSITQVLNDSITVTDNISRSLTQTLNDSITVTDNLVSSAVITQTLNDSISVTDNLATTKSITQTLNDSISVTDNLATTASITQTLNDSIAVTDNLATTKSITQTLNDNISVTDNLVSSAVITQTLNDSISVTDNLATTKSITQTLNDSISVTDNLQQQSPLLKPSMTLLQ